MATRPDNHVWRYSLMVFGIVAAVLALGRNHEALLLCFVLAAVLAAQIFSADDRRRYLRERAAVLATMAGVSVVLLAVPLLLTAQFAALSNRPEVALEKALLLFQTIPGA